MTTAKEVISHWEFLKKLIARENIYADMEIASIDAYFNSELKKDIEHGESSERKRIHSGSK